MKKRILSTLLALCMLVALIPTALFPASAETGASGGGAASQSTATSYKDLYVGIDGSQTENGGTLAVFLTAFKGDSSVDLANGKWNNTVSGATQHATLGGTWKEGTNGGVGYDSAEFDNNYTLSMDASLLPTDTYTLEIVASVRGLTANADGVTPVVKYSTTANMSLGRLRTFLWCGAQGDPRDNNGMPAMVTEADTTTDDGWSHCGLASSAWNNQLTAYQNDLSTFTLAINLNTTSTQHVYRFYKNGEETALSQGMNACNKDDSPYVGKFIINRAMPATYYAVRLYTKPLTKSEMLTNAAVDILIHSGVAFSVYDELDEASRKDFLELVALEDFDTTAEEIEQIADNLAELAAIAGAARAMSDYDKMYVGADGSKTENGGSLVTLLTAYEHNSVALENGQSTWFDKMKNYDATFIGSLWQKLEGGGVGYDLTILADGTGGNNGTDIKLNLGGDALPIEDFTVESVVFYDYLKIVDAEGNIIGDYNGNAWWGGALADAFGQLKVVYDRGNGTTLGSGAHIVRYFIAPGAGGWYSGNYLNGQLYGEASRASLGIYTQQVMRDISVSGSEITAKYSILKNGTATKTGVFKNTGAVSTVSQQGNKFYAEEGSDASFYLFQRAPVDVYAIRVYDTVLTEYEMAFNHFVDMLALAKVELSILENLSAEELAAIVSSFSGSSFTTDKESVKTAIEETLKFYEVTFDPENTLYVTDGLQVLLSSYDGFSTATRMGESEVMWGNAVKAGSYGTLVGKGWYRSEDGGLKIRDTVSQADADAHTVTIRARTNDNFYLTLDYELLPDGDYTIETILAPEGTTVESEDGTISRYFDDYSTYGKYYERAFVLGALRCMGFSCYSHVGDAQMQRRWLYQSTGDWDHPPATGRVQVGVDNALAEVAVDEIINYAIVHDMIEDADAGTSSQYKILYNRGISASLTVGADKYMTNDEVEDKHFDIWRGLASTMYSVRVYDRILTEAEMLQNYVADVCYYFDLDVTLLQQALASIPDKATVFKAFAHLSFDMTKEEAQAALDNGMAGVWIQPAGVGVKDDMSDAIRFYFDLQYSSLAAIMQAGFAVEVGVMVNLGKDEMPQLENGAYDYRYMVFNSVSGADAKYLLDEDTVAVTLTYIDADNALYNEKVRIVSYVKLTDANGDSSYFYGTLTNSGYAENTSLFTVYNYLATQQNVIENGFSDYLNMIALGCYEDVIVYFDSYAEGKGDGSENAPYTNFNDAFDACHDILVGLDAPTNLVLRVAGGIHHVGEIAELDFAEVLFPKYTFTIEGDLEADEAAELTTALNIPTSAFTPWEGKDGIYVYQFEADAEGKFPAFRNLYVDTWSATMAHSTPTTTANGEFPYISRYDRDIDGTFTKAKYYFDKGELENHAPAVEYAGVNRPDLLASYTKHYEWFLAYKDLKAIRNDPSFPTLTPATLRPGMGADYAEAFAHFHEQFTKVLSGDITLDSVSYTVDLVYGSRGVIYLHIDMVEALRTTVEAKLAAMKEAGTYVAGESEKLTLQGLGIELHCVAEWDYNILDLAGVDYQDVVYFDDTRHNKTETLVAVHLDPEQYKEFEIPPNYKMSNRHVFVSNALEFMDTTGEYYYNVETGTLYYYSDSGIDEEIVFSYPTMDNMMIFHDAKNVTIADLTIWGVDDYTLTQIGLAAGQAGSNNTGSKELGQTGFSRRAAIAFYDAYDSTVQDCYIHDIGGAALYFEGRTEGVTITGNEIEMIGDAGIRIRGHASANNEFSNRSGAYKVTVTHNYLHQIAQSIYNTPALYLPSCKDVEVANNTIIGCSYSGMSLGWYWNAATWEEHDRYNLYNVNIHHNYITDFMQNQGDGGAIYMLGGNLKPDNPKQINFIHHNCVIFSDTTGNGLGNQSDGYYFDGSSTNWSNYNNILVMHSAGADRGALEGANDRDYALYMRRRGSHYFFKQYTVESAWSYNIHSTDNFVFNVRSTNLTAQQKETFFMGSDAHWQKCGHKVVGTRYYYGDNKLAFPAAVKAIIEETGATRLHPGEWEWLLSNEY
ncbi:MAG: right-handed parallel beta-helix repeat-containing protein [Clostridia bacterium]|nr:right-handed parallel beta-helix repeat-containing protein [Clostridia bacterium]